MSLYTGKKLHSYDWVETPIDEDVISRVEELAEKENQPLIIDNMPLFEWGISDSIQDNEETDTSVFPADMDEELHTHNVTEIQLCNEANPDISAPNNSIKIIEVEDEDAQSENIGPDPDEELKIEEEGAQHPIDENNEIDDVYKDIEQLLDDEIKQINEIPEVYPSDMNDSHDSHTSTSSEYVNTPEVIEATSKNDIEDGVRRTSRKNVGKRGPTLQMDMKGKDYRTVNYQLFMGGRDGKN